MKKQLKEDIKRFKEIINYDIKNELIVESESAFSDVIVDELKPSLPLNDSSSDLNAITLLQRTLVDLGKLNKSYGIDGDGVDGDFGTDTKNALYSTIKSKELNNTNIDDFEGVLDDNIDKITTTLIDHKDFFKRFEAQAGVSLSAFQKCKSITDYEELDFVVKNNMCHSNVNIAETLNEVFPDESPINKSAILSIMMKEQGKGKKVCAPNNNYAGIQTDAGRWGSLDEKIDAQFCAKDAEKIRSFASFDNLSNGLSFIKKSFDRKNWFIKLMTDSNDENVGVEEVDIEKISKKHADIWQTKWNLSLNDDEYKRFKKYGFNPFLRNKSFTDSKGIYEKSVSSLSAEEKKEHNKKEGTYRSPQKIQRSLDSVSKYFKMAYDIFEGLNDSGEIFVVEPEIEVDNEIAIEPNIADVENQGMEFNTLPYYKWWDDDYESVTDTTVMDRNNNPIEIGKGDAVPMNVRWKTINHDNKNITGGF